jgi:hypothetical protein
MAFFRQILRSYFADNDWDDTLKMFRVAIANGGSVPEDILWCLDWIVEHPPENLGALLYEDGWITLRHPGQEEEGVDGAAYTPAEQVAWLRERTAELRADYESRGAKS